jgi:hypothetical protein
MQPPKPCAKALVVVIDRQRHHRHRKAPAAHRLILHFDITFPWHKNSV